ncbi:MAG TPA: mannonate dehydratase [Vicinamibacterales bacterium]|nr:mannonate dehydratase [Vicinamibacterales bacterium]
MMHRREFVRWSSGVTAGVLAESLVSAQIAAQPRSGGTARPARMKAGTQHGDTDAILRVLAGFGVNHICSRLPSARMDEAWAVESLQRLRERVESFGITLDMVPLPLSSFEISRSENPAILLGKDPERDRQIDDICEMIRNTARAGIPAVKYNLTLIGIPRTAPTIGRGGARYSTFVYADGKQDPALTIAGPVDADLYWERITYFLERVVPVAEEYRVRLACHPQDPGMPRGKGWRGVETVLGSVEGLQRFVTIAESPYHGLNFCQGTVSEMLEKPGEQIFDVIRDFGTRGKIFNVHFRNIAGGFLDFRETFIDDGDVDMLRAMRVYREVGYDGMMMPDHVPAIDGDTGNLQGFAFAFGYIKALIAAVAAES